MARLCIDSNFFSIDANGNLTFKRESVGLRQLLTFTTVGTATFTKANFPGLTRLRVRAVGGGGGGAGANAAAGEAIARAGGGGGGYSESVLNASALGATETITVGVGGDGGNGGGNDPGEAGGQSSFGGFVIARGGGGAPASMTSDTLPAMAPGGFGATIGTGQIASPGGNSDSGIRLASLSVLGGGGGNSGGGLGAGGRSVGSDNAGANGTGYGGGGGGACSLGASFNGGTGSRGAVFIELYF